MNRAKCARYDTKTGRPPFRDYIGYIMSRLDVESKLVGSLPVDVVFGLSS